MVQEIYNLHTVLYNGTVTMEHVVETFFNEDLANEVKNVVEERNRNSEFTVDCYVEKGIIYENREDVPILNESID